MGYIYILYPKKLQFSAYGQFVFVTLEITFLAGYADIQINNNVPYLGNFLAAFLDV